MQLVRKLDENSLPVCYIKKHFLTKMQLSWLLSACGLQVPRRPNTTAGGALFTTPSIRHAGMLRKYPFGGTRIRSILVYVPGI